MIIDIKIPSPGESITEVEIGKWLVEDGAMVNKNQEIAEIESDKATLSLTALSSGRIKILLNEGARVSVGSIACTIDSDDIEPPAKDKTKQSVNKTTDAVVISPAMELKSGPGKPDVIQKESADKITTPVKFTPAARAVMEAEGLSIDDVINGIRRLTRQDVESVVKLLKIPGSVSKTEMSRSEERSPMSPLRRKLGQRLVAVKNETAMLTTFNEIDMSRLIQLRTNHQQAFTEKYGFKLGYMSFFTKGVSIALSQHPAINSMIDGEEILTPLYHDIGIAVQTPKGLMVPVIRNAETKNIEEIEFEIKELAEKARNKKLTIQEMSGGTFTITNGGLFGSLMSTPILNPPQSAILGMHAIKDRPVAVDGRVEIRPMMYVALSYDHRLIDGKESVGFLVKLKELIEEPSALLFQGKNPEDLLLGL